jgi:GntR family transcriptional regulator, phosphonate transport system regulatory protein
MRLQKGTKGYIDRAGGIALWRQVADYLRQQIADGAYDVRMMLPPEIEIASKMGVNRHTVRSAIAALVAEGIVRPVQGVGTIIRQSRKFKLPISRRTRFSESVALQAKSATAALLSSRIETAPDEICSQLGLKPGSNCIVLETTHMADGLCISTATNWFEAEPFAQMPVLLRETGSVSAALAACGVADYVRLSTEISAIHANAEDLARLKLAAGAIVLETKAVNSDLAGKPIQFARSRFDAGRISLFISFDGSV